MKTLKSFSKRTFYALDPRTFKDGNQDGYGDLIGLARQVSYFSMLGIDALVLRNVWKDLPLAKQTFTSLRPEIGAANQLAKLIRLFQDKGIKVLLEISLAGIDPRHIFLRPASASALQEQAHLARHGQLPTREQYLLGDLTTDVVLNQQRENFLISLTKLINYWHKFGLAGLVVTDFEQLFDFKKTAVLGEQTKLLLKRIYTIVKMVSDQFLWIGMANLLNPQTIRTQNLIHDPLFDYLGTYDFSLLGKDHAVSAKTPKVKFAPRQYVKLARDYVNYRRGLHGLSSHLAGRIISRWASDYAYHAEAGKSLLFLLLLHAGSSFVYQGDEMAQPNHFALKQSDLKLVKHVQFPQTWLTKEKDRKAEQLRQLRYHHHAVHAHGLMAWDESEFSGFSKTAPRISYVYPTKNVVSVKKQFQVKNSVWHFFRSLNAYLKNQTIISLKIACQTNGLIVFRGRTNRGRFLALVNVSRQRKRVRLWNRSKQVMVVFSSYSHRDYSTFPKRLDAFESLLYLIKPRTKETSAVL